MKDINEMEQCFAVLNGQVERTLREVLDFRRNNPQGRAQSVKVIENELVALGKMVKRLSQESNDDLMQGISLLKIKMMC